MTVATLEQLETDIARLSLPEQLWLIERVMHRLRKTNQPPLQVAEHDLALMAADPALQRELHQINAAFSVTELDGLERL